MSDPSTHTSDNRPQTGKKAVVVSKYADATQEEDRPALNDALMEGRAVELDYPDNNTQKGWSCALVNIRMSARSLRLRSIR